MIKIGHISNDIFRHNITLKQMILQNYTCTMTRANIMKFLHRGGGIFRDPQKVRMWSLPQLTLSIQLKNMHEETAGNIKINIRSSCNMQLTSKIYIYLLRYRSDK
mmetsp:Transcript_4788/g.9468  ORF Transcript_4788/g.9468 Transcript_4788/m.9468 type:complete len:105 (-) Transcript_4788:257-571(-)